MEKNNKKHVKYYDSYKPNDYFWGIGIENETYLEIDSMEVNNSFFKNQKRERYSVNYFDTYLSGYFNKALLTVIENDKLHTLPLLINAHELTKNDLSGQPMNNYDKGATPNKKFSGKTVFEHMKEKNKYFFEEYEKSFCFDGDTLEFMTQKFYKTTINKVIEELKNHKKLFLKQINALDLPYGKLIKYPSENYGFAVFTTNKNNIAIFNNGTYHFNFTLPTQLDGSGNLINKMDFKVRHQKAIRLIQLMEPFFIAKYGTADILSRSSEYRFRFPKGSQRCAASRYIGVGTYDANKMKSGKLLQDERKNIAPPFYTKLYKQINYKPLEQIGFDINYNKFKNHGIEIRFFDWFDEEKLYEVLQFIVHLLDFSESRKESIPKFTTHELWNSITYKAILDGSGAILSSEEIIWLRNQLEIKKSVKQNNIVYVYDFISEYFHNKFKYNGPVSKYMLEKPSLFAKCFGWCA